MNQLKVVFYLVLSNLVLLDLVSCAITTKHTEGVQLEQKGQNERADIENANRTFNNLKYQEALELYQDFQRVHPNSNYYLVARLGEAESLENLERWGEAVNIYKYVYDTTATAQPTLAVKATYRLSFCYEALGDDIKAVATLLDSLKKKSFLPIEVGSAEVPARLAMFYGKEQNFIESDKYLDLAQKGIAELQGHMDIPKVTLAKAYFQMGSVSLNQMAIENLSEALHAQKSVQIYLLKAMDMSVEPWSAEAAKKLKKNYRDIWNILFVNATLGGNESTLDLEAQTRMRRKRQVSLGAEFLDLVQNAEYYKSIDEKKMTICEVDFFHYLKEIRKSVENELYRADEEMPLTSESKKLNGVKRPGRIRAESKSKKLDNSIGKDPNL